MDQAATSPFQQVKALFTGLFAGSASPIHLTPEQRIVLHSSQSPVAALDPDTKQEYGILQREVFEKIKQVFDVEEVDPSFFECEELDFVIDSPRTL